MLDAGSSVTESLQLSRTRANRELLSVDIWAMSKASLDAAAYAAKKKAQMEHAVALRARKSGHANHEVSLLDTNQKSKNVTTSSINGYDVESESIGQNTERIAIRRQVDDKKKLPQLISADPNSSRFAGDNLDGSYSNLFFRPPADPSGKQIDLSDRPLLCASFDAVRGEAVFGGSDHALYSVNINEIDSKRGPKTVKMYSKTCGHADWVTSVAHLKDGRVISASMDGKLCLWDAGNRSHGVDLINGHTKSVSKVVSSPQHNIALSCSYDNNVVLWSFNEKDNDSHGNPTGPGPVKGKSNTSSAAATSTKFSIMCGHKEPVVDCTLSGCSMALSGDRKGGLIMWDLATGAALRTLRTGHRGSITQLLSLNGSSHTNGDGDGDGESYGSCMFLSAGVDGMVRLWDARDSDSKAAMEIPAHATMISEGGRHGMSGAAISCLASLLPRGGSAISSVVTGGADSIICLLDARMSFRVVERWEHHRTGIYSICPIGNDCVLSGDGSGMMHCYSINSSPASDSHGEDSKVGYGNLRYGLGCSGEGAIRAIGCIGNKIITANEDGKALVLIY